MSRWRQWWDQGVDRIAASSIGQKVWAYYEVAAPNEQLALKLLGAAVVVVLALTILVAPLHQFNKNAQAGFRHEQDTLAWMQANRALVGTGGGAVGTRPAGASLLALANQSAKGVGISFKRYEPNGDKGLNLWLEKVPFNQVVTWLAALEREYGVIAVDFSASRRDEAGLVDVRVSLAG